jgi:hypothetical protein
LEISDYDVVIKKLENKNEFLLEINELHPFNKKDKNLISLPFEFESDL